MWAGGGAGENEPEVRQDLFSLIRSTRYLAAQSEEAIPPVIETTNGNVHGTVTYLRDDVTSPVYTYRGIPYAAPPVGKLRFAPPEPVEKWRREYDGTSQGKCGL